jgi:hypothetical protein
MKFSDKIMVFIPIIVLVIMLLPFGAVIGADSKADNEKHLISVPDTTFEDTIFREIHVTPEGTYGVDSSGEEWEYDFSRDEFIKKDKSKKTTKTTFRKRRDPAESADKADPALILDPDEGYYITTRKLDGLKIGAVTVEADEEVKGSIVAVGAVTVKGRVLGDVTSYKKITITSKGKIKGDARAPKIDKKRGGYVSGRCIETEMPEIPEFEIGIRSSYIALNVNIIILIGLLLSGLLAVAIAPRPIERVKCCLRLSFIKSFFVGFLIWIAFGPFFGLLCLTIVGIPIAILALPMVTLLAVILAIVGLSQLTGEKFSKYVGGSFSSRLGQTILGILILDSFWIFFSMFHASSSDVAQGFATFFLVLAIIIWSIGLTAGMGAIMLTRFGSRDCRKIIVDELKPDYVQPPPPPTPPPLSSNN